MSDTIVFVLTIAVSVVVVLTLVGLFLSRMYRRATKEMALVRTGFGGEKVIADGGILVFPVLHQFIKVKMNTIKLNVRRDAKEALITKDRLRVDVSADFYLRVKKDKNAIANAATTLGDLTHNKDDLKKLMEGKFIDALRAVAAVMTMDELHERRADFVQQVQTAVTDELDKNGLELETVSLVGLDQTLREHFDENNAFDAEGLKKLTEITESKKKERNDIEQTTAVQISQKNMESAKRQLEISQDQEMATANQKKTVEVEKAKQKAEEKEAFEEQRAKEEEAQIKASEKIEAATIHKQKTIEEAEIEKRKTLEMAEQDKAVAIAKKSEEKSAAEAEANKKKAEAIEAEEKIETAREIEIANRRKSIAIVKAEEEAEEKAVGIKVAAEADKEAAQSKAEAITIKAEADAEAIKIAAEATEKKNDVDAAGKLKLYEAENKLSPEIIAMQIKMKTIENAASIITAAGKPIEKIDGIKIVQLGGLDGIVNNGGSAGSGQVSGGGNIANDLVNGLMKYRTLTPLIESLLKEANLDPSSMSGTIKSLIPDVTEKVGDSKLPSAKETSENGKTLDREPLTLGSDIPDGKEFALEPND